MGEFWFKASLGKVLARLHLNQETLSEKITKAKK
jgi:hypothetical protein